MRPLRDPLHPYAWELTYTNGRRLCRDSPGGPWTEARVPLEGLCELAVFGHPASPLRVEVGWAQRAALAGVCFRVRGTLILNPDLTSILTRRWLVGVVDTAGGVDGWRIDSAGMATRYRGTLAEW